MAKNYCRFLISTVTALSTLALGQVVSAEVISKPIVSVALAAEMPSYSEVYVLNLKEKKNNKEWWLDRVQDNLQVDISASGKVNPDWNYQGALMTEYSDKETVSLSKSLSTCKVRTDGENDGSGARYFLVRECRFTDNTNGIASNGSFNYRAELVPYGNASDASGVTTGKIWTFSADGVQQIKESFRQAMVDLTNNVIAPQVGQMFAGFLAVGDPTITENFDDQADVPTEVWITDRGHQIRINHAKSNGVNVAVDLGFNQ